MSGRMSRPMWKQGLRERRRRRGHRGARLRGHRRPVRPVAGEHLPRAARQRRRRPHRQPPRPRRHQLRRRRRVRQLAGGAVHGPRRAAQRAHATLVITGGVDTFNDIFMYMCFSKTPALSPTGDCRPFGDQADGTILGEGLGDGGAEAARRRRARRRPDLRGDPRRRHQLGRQGQERLRAARAGAGAGAAPGLRATPATGPTPSSWSRRTAPARRSATPPSSTGSARSSARRGPAPTQWCALGSVKSQIGHTKAAAGAAGLIKAALALLTTRCCRRRSRWSGRNPALGLETQPVLPQHRGPAVDSRRRPTRAARRSARSASAAPTSTSRSRSTRAPTRRCASTPRRCACCCSRRPTPPTSARSSPRCRRP